MTGDSDSKNWIDVDAISIQHRSPWITTTDGRQICRTCGREHLIRGRDYNEHRRFWDWYIPLSGLFILLTLIALAGSLSAGARP